MENSVVSCHQPNFLPWMGYFAKAMRSDTFVVLDDVQFTMGHNKHNWTSRVKIFGLPDSKWISVPVLRSSVGKQLVRDLRIDPSDHRWKRKITSTLRQVYLREPFFDLFFPEIESKIFSAGPFLYPLNFDLIQWVFEHLKLTTRLVPSSQFGTDLTSNERLVHLTKVAGGTTYLSGDGAMEYQVESLFTNAGILIKKLGFKSPTYFQVDGAPFQAGLSIVDSLFRLGGEKTRSLLVQTVAASTQENNASTR